MDLVVNIVIGWSQLRHHLLFRVLQGPAVLRNLKSLPFGLESLENESQFESGAIKS